MTEQRQIWNRLQSSILPFEWGLVYDSIRYLVNGTTFRIRSVEVRIEYDMGTFRVTIENERNRIVWERLLLEEIISTIDLTVKHCCLFRELECEKAV